MAAFPALLQVIGGAGEGTGLAGVLGQVPQEAEGVGRELLAFHEVCPEGAVFAGDATGADYAQLRDELALDGVDFPLELGEGHEGRLLALIYMDEQVHG